MTDPLVDAPCRRFEMTDDLLISLLRRVADGEPTEKVYADVVLHSFTLEVTSGTTG